MKSTDLRRGNKLQKDQPTSQEIYRKVIIKSEDDLPKEDGEYFVNQKPGFNLTVYPFTKAGHFDNRKYWVNHIDWYLEPIAQPSPDSQAREEEQEGQDCATCKHLRKGGYPCSECDDRDMWSPQEAKQSRTAEDAIKEFVIQWGQEGMYDKTLDKAIRKLLKEYRREGLPDTGKKVMMTSDEYYGLNGEKPKA